MKRVSLVACLCGIALGVVGCTTTGNVRAPQGTQLYLNDDPVKVEANGDVETRPYHWGQSSGIPYRLERDGKVVQEGRLHSEFRVVSFFWPPYALLYWPMGFRSDTTYDLTRPNRADDYAAETVHR